MKKILSLFAMLGVVSLAACDNKSDDYVIENGDIVTLTAESLIVAGVPQKTTNDKVNITVGLEDNAPGVNEGLLGLKKGDIKTIVIKYPGEYETPPQPFTVEATFKVIGIKKAENPVELKEPVTEEVDIEEVIVENPAH